MFQSTSIPKDGCNSTFRIEKKIKFIYIDVSQIKINKFIHNLNREPNGYLETVIGSHIMIDQLYKFLRNYITKSSGLDCNGKPMILL